MTYVERRNDPVLPVHRPPAPERERGWEAERHRTPLKTWARALEVSPQVKRLALLLRERFGFGLVVLIVVVALVLFGRLLRVQPRMLLAGLGSALVLVFSVGLLLLPGGAGLECTANT